MRLFTVELTRLRWRRAVIVLLACCFLVPALIWAGLAWNTRPFSDAEVRDAQAQVDAQINSPEMKHELHRCETHPREFGLTPSTKELCTERIGVPQLEWYLYREQLDVPAQRQETGLAVITILAALAMLVGTTFAGHDWNSGSMSNQLLFEPRRLRVWAAKAAVVFLMGLVTGAAVLAAYWGGLSALANARDLTVPAHEWELIRESAGRGALLVALAGVGGYALTMFFRSTVATLGVLFAVTVGGTLVMVTVLGEYADRWLLTTNVMAVVFDGVEYYSPAAPCAEDPSMTCSQTLTLTLADGAAYLGGLLAVAVVLSLWSFRRRDVP
ncbi:MAG TPA: ABC transporter permease subunit [Nocardioides sp.]